MTKDKHKTYKTERRYLNIRINMPLWKRLENYIHDGSVKDLSLTAAVKEALDYFLTEKGY